MNGQGRQRYNGFIKTFVPLCLMVYFIVGYSRIRTTDIVPFSAWALFIFVPNQPKVYTVQFDSLDGKALNPPVRLEDGTLANPHDVTATYIFNHFGMAWEKGNLEEAQGFRNLLEKNVFGGKQVAWQLIQTTYDPLERWKTGKVSERPVAHFSSGESR